MSKLTAKAASVAIISAAAARGLDPLDVANCDLRHNMGAVRAAVCLALAWSSGRDPEAVGVALGFFDDRSLASMVVARFRRSPEIRDLALRILSAVEAGEVSRADLVAVRAQRVRSVLAVDFADLDDDAKVAAFLRERGATPCPPGMVAAFLRERGATSCPPNAVRVSRVRAVTS